MNTKKLCELAKTIRSKNAGTDRITFDIIFTDRENYELVKNSGILNKEFISRLYNVPQGRICDFVEYDPGLAIKFTIERKEPSGSPGEGDIFGCQQYPPLLNIEIPDRFPVSGDPAGDSDVRPTAFCR
ncbi:MAG: DUF4387 domain-containing protein [Victivallales bacterium]|nr:DUF4387 domain-containing protein [Victivallales bacterium]